MNSTEIWEHINKVILEASNWSLHEANQNIMGANALRVQKKVRNSRIRLHKLERAFFGKPALGIYGPSQSGKSYLTSKIAQQSDGRLQINIKQKYEFLEDINPEGGRESTAVVTRFSVNKINFKEKYPVTVSLITESDIVCILANSFGNFSTHVLTSGLGPTIAISPFNTFIN